ncbi:MAG: hypothetical protein M1508_13875 [Nitrospirae bacterium]|nr:hypothetical protein [Nitrospirota bacterium]
MRSLWQFIPAVLLFFMFPSDASSEVIVHDLIAAQGKRITIRIETRGKFFSKGGEVVMVSINGKAAGNVLSGGDGFAFRQFTPVKTGIHRITAKSGADEGSGLLLSLKKGTGIVFVDVEGSLLESPFSRKPRSGSKEGIQEINRKYPVVFLSSGKAGTGALKAWLKENGFPELPVVPWDEGKIFDDILEKGLTIRAIIGSPDIIVSAREYRPGAFSFSEAEGAKEVKNWEEIRKILRSGGF